MILLALSLVVAAQPALPEVKLVAPGLTVTGLSAPVADPLTDQLARAFTGIRVVTPRDITALLGLERQKQLMGCEAGECMAELGNALGVQGVLLGSLAKLGMTVQINVKIIDPSSGRELGAASERVGSEDEIFDALTRVGKSLRVQFLKALNLPTEEPAGATEGAHLVNRGTRRFFPIPLAIGGAAAIGGVVFLVFSEQAYQRLTTGAQGSISRVDANSVAQNGSLFQTLGAVCITVGAAAIVAGVGLLVFGSSGDGAHASLGVAPNGLVLAGEF